MHPRTSAIKSQDRSSRSSSVVHYAAVASTPTLVSTTNMNLDFYEDELDLSSTSSDPHHPRSHGGYVAGSSSAESSSSYGANSSVEAPSPAVGGSGGQRRRGSKGGAGVRPKSEAFLAYR